jgi:hypothetical protein
MRKRLNDGYTCKCGEANLFPMWVFAHWDDEISHGCKCGRLNKIRKGIPKIGRLKKRRILS